MVSPQSPHPQEEAPLTSPNWRLRGAIVQDLENLTTVGDWRPTFDPERGIFRATARGDQGAYTLVNFQGELSLVLARDEADLDLGKIMREQDVGFKIRELAESLRSATSQQIAMLERLPELATKPVAYIPAAQCWRASSGAGASYLYYEDGPGCIQVTCLPGEETHPSYLVKMQGSPEVPWVDVTEIVRSCPRSNQAVRMLLRSPIN